MRIKAFSAFLMGICLVGALDAAVEGHPWFVLIQMGLFVLNAWVGYERKDIQ